MKNSVLILLILSSVFIQTQEKYQLPSHISDISRGKLVSDAKMALSKQDENQDQVLIDEKYTDNSGRIKDFLREESNRNNNGVYKLTFYITPYFEELKQETSYPFIKIVFEIKDNQHYHVPTTLSPYGYSAYRGS